MDVELKRILDRQDAKLTAILQSQRKLSETWANAAWVFSITGWDKATLKRAREQHLIRFKETEKSTYLYLLESIPEILKKKVS